jgi:hypothetical protein
MKEINQLSTRDLELLSAYIDGELSARGLARLLPRLDREPGLKQALEDMKAVVQQLGSLPEAPLPRSFTLTPDVVGIRSRPRAYPVFQLATALAAIAFVALVGLDTVIGQFSLASRGAVMSDMVQEALVACKKLWLPLHKPRLNSAPGIPSLRLMTKAMELMCWRRRLPGSLHRRLWKHQQNPMKHFVRGFRPHRNRRQKRRLEGRQSLEKVLANSWLSQAQMNTRRRWMRRA